MLVALLGSFSTTNIKGHYLTGSQTNYITSHSENLFPKDSTLHRTIPHLFLSFIQGYHRPRDFSLEILCTTCVLIAATMAL
jgi:hypothetical protein